MPLSKPIKNILVNEIKSALEKMKSSEDPNLIMFYFSAVYAILHRIYNIEYDPDLVFAHFILNGTYQQINARLKAPDPVIQIPEGFFDKLTKTTEDFLEAIENNKKLYEVLKKFTLLGYVTIGNGYYLYQKGLLKI
jgi:hypothetical protein